MAINGKTVLAVIPARSGSKRCPNKNFLAFRGKHLYEWAVEAASRSKYIYAHILSLDKDRPPELCADEASCEDVLRYHQAQTPHEWLVLLQPTSPLRTVEDIDACIERAGLGWGCVSVGLNGKPNGAVYVTHKDWLAKHDFSALGLAKYPMPEERSLDINYLEDFK